MRLAFAVVALATFAPALPALAQPAASAVVEAWRRDWREAARDVAGVGLDETLTRRLDGPRGDVTLLTQSRIVYGPPDREGRGAGRGERQVRTARVDGEPVPGERIREVEERLGRAFGPGASEATRHPARLPGGVLDDASATALTLDTVQGRPARRVALRLERGPGGRPGGPPDARPDRAEAWFTRSAEAPRLIRVRVEGERPHGATVVRTVDYERTAGLDLPAEARSTVSLRQRRRLRVYATTITAEARYTRPEVVRR